MTGTSTELGLEILLIDDEQVIHQSVGEELEMAGYGVLHADTAEEGLTIFQDQEADLIISDIKMPGMDGIELVHRLGAHPGEIEVILITGYGDEQIAVDALRAGAFDLLAKPLKLQDLHASLQRTRRYRDMRREKDRIQERLDVMLRSGKPDGDPHEIIGESQAIQNILTLVDQVAGAERTTVLIEGESGTGKELVARAIHDKSPRAANPFVSINCTAIPENLLESELFGHEKGAFTDAREQKKGLLELANGGTLFLDEIGDMSVSAQAKILRALEERRVRRVGGSREIDVDVRLVSATNQDLDALVQAGTFRQDLYFRLNVFAIPLPPLHARGDDVLLLAYYFLQQYAREFRKAITAIDPSAQSLLKTYRFPGNIRELRNIIERAVIVGKEPTLQPWDFPERLVFSEDDNDPADPFNLDSVERRTIRAALRHAQNRRGEAARLLGTSRDSLRRRMQKYGIE